MSELPNNLHHLRQDYRKDALDESDLGDNPVLFFRKWFAEANDSGELEANAMSVSSVDGDGNPHCRMVLLKSIEDEGFVFFTNYESNKGQQIAQNPNVALLFFWSNLERQVRIEGVTEKLQEEFADAYFESRPEGSKLSAIISPQSQIIPDRYYLEELYASTQKSLEGKELVRPKNWGGFLVKPKKIEFWQGRSNRLHDRIVFELNENSSWNRYRLAP